MIMCPLNPYYKSFFHTTTLALLESFYVAQKLALSSEEVFSRKFPNCGQLHSR